MNKSNYILSIQQISAQQPLCNSWFENPVEHSEPCVFSIDPPFRQFFEPNSARRFGKIIKRALITSKMAMKESGIANPDAIIAATGLGCIESSELFLNKLTQDGETLLNPTPFMHSTHNTISSIVAIEAKCHGYNSTYSHRGISFECALQDALMQLNNDRIQSSLVCANDELTPDLFSVLKKTDCFGKNNQIFASETSVAMMISKNRTENALCCLDSVDKIYLKAGAELDYKIDEEIDYIVVGVDSDPQNDEIYLENCARLFPGIPLLSYKHIFGNNFTSSAFAIYSAAVCLKKETVPNFMLIDKKCGNKINHGKILCYNSFKNKNHTFTLLSKI